MRNIKIYSLIEKPEYTEICAAWLYGHWLCHREGETLKKSIEYYQEQNTDIKKVILTWIAIAEGKIAGTATLDYADHEDHKDLTPWLANVYVHPHFRGQNIASSLIKHIKEEAKKMGYPHIYLFTPDAMELYKNLGWKFIKNIRDPSGMHEAEKLMKTEL